MRKLHLQNCLEEILIKTERILIHVCMLVKKKTTKKRPISLIADSFSNPLLMLDLFICLGQLAEVKPLSWPSFICVLFDPFSLEVFFFYFAQIIATFCEEWGGGRTSLLTFLRVI